MIKTSFDGGDIPKEKVEYVCISCISIDSVLKADRKYYPQVYLEQCKYKIKKKRNEESYRLLNSLNTDSDYESD